MESCLNCKHYYFEWNDETNRCLLHNWLICSKQSDVDKYICDSHKSKNTIDFSTYNFRKK